MNIRSYEAVIHWALYMHRSVFRLAAVASSAAIFLVASPVFAKPIIGTVSPVSATAGTSLTLSASVSSGIPIQSCNLYVDLADVGEMTVSGSTASKSYTFPFGGSRIAFVFCRDTGSGMSAGANTAIWVTGATETEAPLSVYEPEMTPEPISEPVASKLVKLICPEGADVNDPCKAVYYIDADGKRHAFPNSRVFYSWYENFDAVVEVDQATLATHSLGRNVRYRPGERMVKFTTDQKVYAVSAHGELRWVKTEEVAVSLYGSDWNTKIDDISDAFYTDYSLGEDILSEQSFSPTAVMNSIVEIDADIR